ASRTTELSRLNTWPTGATVNASTLASRPAAHDSGPMWFALPSIVRDLHPLLLPVSRRTCVHLRALRWIFFVIDRTGRLFPTTQPPPPHSTCAAGRAHTAPSRHRND